MNAYRRKALLSALFRLSEARGMRLQGQPHRYVAMRIEWARIYGRWALVEE